jgi:ribonuclease-3
LSEIEWAAEKLGLSFDSPALLVEALTHPSFLNENPETARASYQRLEFLGDAVLGYIAAAELFRRFPTLPEGELTKLRAHLVQERTLAAVGESLNLGNRLYMGRGEEANGGRQRSSNLAEAVEALIGAAYLDKGEHVAKNLILRLLYPEIDQVEKRGHAPVDPKSRLQEVVQARHESLPQYRVVDERGPDHQRTFTVEVLLEDRIAGVGVASRKVDAEREAAAIALKSLAASTTACQELPQC